jgi:hypothetical protein
VIAPGSEHLTVLGGTLCQEVLETSYVVRRETSHCMSVADFGEGPVFESSSVHLLLFGSCLRFTLVVRTKLRYRQRRCVTSGVLEAIYIQIR